MLRARLRLLLPLHALVLALVATLACAKTDSDLDVKVKIVGDEIRADISLFVPAPRQRVWEVLTDYERAPQFTRDLEVSRIVARSGDTLRLFQKAQVRLGPFAIPVETLKDIRLSAPYRTESRLVGGSLRKYDVTTDLVPDGGGTRIIVHSVAIPNNALATMFGEGRIKRETEQHFRDLRAEILRREHLAASQ